MSEADIKLRIIRLIDSQEGEVLRELYDMILSKLYQDKKHEEAPFDAIKMGYQEMAKDLEREGEAFEWIEGTLNSEEL